ncbi:MAG: helix-turn-helix transcriptional regulator [Clostridiales bacterium]|nr:helix-turn-helix transcriptional regulator [Clostridiales bacterium]
MKNIREIVSSNLVSLRKQNKLTQLELSEKINYSDKAISRWEKGEVLPDLEILQQLSLIYDVPLGYLIEEHAPEQVTKTAASKFNIRIAIMFFSIMIVWMSSVICYAYLSNYLGINYWQIFLWAVPSSALILDICVRVWFNKKYCPYTMSLFLWTFISAFYVQLLQYNLWLVFLIGIPCQLTIIFMSFIRRAKGK